MTENMTAGGQENGAHFFAGDCRFITAATTPGNLPQETLPEVAFAGRSNVGKSSLINALTGRRALARVSQTPGRTRQINFFQCRAGLILADLPGYGYAKVSRSEINAWKKLTRAFIANRQTLRRVFILIDSRRGIGDNDRGFMGMLDDAAVSWAVVLTRADKVKADEVERIAADTEKEVATRPAAFPGIFTTSARTRQGLEALRDHIALLAPAHDMGQNTGAETITMGIAR